MQTRHKKKEKKNRTNFDLTTDSLIEKYCTISVKFKICLSQLIVKIEPKQLKLKPNQTLLDMTFSNLTSFF